MHLLTYSPSFVAVAFFSTHFIKAETLKADLPSKKETQQVLNQAQKRARDLLKKKAAFHQQFKNKNLVTFPDIKKKYPQLQKQTQQLKLLYAEVLKTPTESNKTKLLKKLQPIGRFLQDAPTKKINHSYTKEQLRQLRWNLQQNRKPKDDPQAPRLQLLTTPMLYTLHQLPVPIKVKAPPLSRVFFQSTGGGAFADNLNVTSVQANKRGEALAFWKSQGDAVGSAEITITAPTCQNAEHLNIQIVELNLLPLAEMSTKWSNPTITPSKKMTPLKDLKK